MNVVLVRMWSLHSCISHREVLSSQSAEPGA